METVFPVYDSLFVAPFTGAWIEILNSGSVVDFVATSHPSRVRGLKSHEDMEFKTLRASRTLHGCVD